MQPAQHDARHRGATTGQWCHPTPFLPPHPHPTPPPCPSLTLKPKRGLPNRKCRHFGLTHSRGVRLRLSTTEPTAAHLHLSPSLGDAVTVRSATCPSGERGVRHRVPSPIRASHWVILCPIARDAGFTLPPLLSWWPQATEGWHCLPLSP